MSTSLSISMNKDNAILNPIAPFVQNDDEEDDNDDEDEALDEEKEKEKDEDDEDEEEDDLIQRLNGRDVHD